MHEPKHIATFYLPEDETDLNAMSTREVTVTRLGESYLIYPAWLVPGKLMFDPCKELAKKYGLNKPLLTLNHFPSYDELCEVFDGKTILPIMPEWKEYGFKFFEN